MRLYSGRLIIERIFTSEFWGLFFGLANFLRNLLSEFYGSLNSDCSWLSPTPQTELQDLNSTGYSEVLKDGYP